MKLFKIFSFFIMAVYKWNAKIQILFFVFRKKSMQHRQINYDEVIQRKSDSER